MFVGRLGPKLEVLEVLEVGEIKSRSFAYEKRSMELACRDPRVRQSVDHQYSLSVL